MHNKEEFLSRINHAQDVSFWGAPLRPLATIEIKQLEKQGNFCDSWEKIAVTKDFETARIAGCRFEGRVVLGRLGPQGGLFRSTLVDSEVADGALLDQNTLIRKTWVDYGVEILSSRFDCLAATSYGLGRKLILGPETGSRWLPVSSELNLETAQTWVNSSVALQKAQAEALDWRSEVSYLGPGCRLSGVVFANQVCLGAHVVAQGCAVIEDSWVWGSPERPVFLGAGIVLRSSVVFEGVQIDTHALVERSVFLEVSGAKDQARVNESLIAPNTHIEAGEVRSSLLGPFVGLHHQSLLISCWWPAGRGNLGYGANVGSNHTSRAPDQELRPGEGMFFGLDCAIKFPADFTEAPYSLVATSVVTLPQRLSLPFSLILEDTRSPLSGLTRIIPGWVLEQNLYFVWRSELKFLQRNKAQDHSWDLRVLRPEIVDKLWKAGENLANKVGKSVYTSKEISEVGENYLLEKDRVQAVITYRNFTFYGACRLLAEKTYGLSDCDEGWLVDIFQRLGTSLADRKPLLKAFIDQEERLLAQATASKAKDEHRGRAIFDDYDQFHVVVADDPVLKQKSLELLRWREQILNEN